MRTFPITESVANHVLVIGENMLTDNEADNTACKIHETGEEVDDKLDDLGSELESKLGSLLDKLTSGSEETPDNLNQGLNEVAESVDDGGHVVDVRLIVRVGKIRCGAGEDVEMQGYL
jgi:hypothetical protein